MTVTLGDASFELRDDTDMKLFDGFLRGNPDVREKLLKELRSGQVPIDAVTGFAEHVKAIANTAAGVRSPTELTLAVEEFVGSRAALAKNRRTTADEKRRTLDNLLTYLRAKGRMGTKLHVHEVLRSDLLSFITDYAARPSTRALAAAAANKDEGGRSRPGSSGDLADQANAPTLSPRTVAKAIGHLDDFWVFALARDMCAVNPIDKAFHDAVGGLKSAASEAKRSESYDLFNREELQKIFDPHRYLKLMNAADCFWSPLIGLFTGARLGEIVTLRVDDIAVDPDAGIHCLAIADDGFEGGRRTKNWNSVRDVPIPDALIDLGFLDYVAHMRSLGAEALFPHREANDTRRDDPSKLVSREFSKYLKAIGIKTPKKVFHSFRHTAITSFHAKGVDVPYARLIVGHASQQAHQRFDSVRGGSTHARYSHPEKYDADGVHFLVRLRDFMNRVSYPIDLRTLRVAAQIVTETTVRRGDGSFDSGWHTNNARKTKEMLARLDAACKASEQ